MGDCSKLKLILRLEEVKKGHVCFVFPHFYLKNESENEILLDATSIRCINSFMKALTVSITDRAGNSVEKKRFAERCFPYQYSPDMLVITGVIMRFGRLQPGKEIKIYSPGLPLDRYFDLSVPGRYQIISRLSHNTVIFDPPLESEPLTFRVRLSAPLKSDCLVDSDYFNDGAVSLPIKQFADLPPQGDYSKLKHILRLNKTEYKEAEPVFFRSYLKNESEGVVHVCLGGDMFASARRWCLADAEDNDVPKLSHGKNRLSDRGPDADVLWMVYYPCFVKLGPGEEMELDNSETQVNLYFDVSLPGKYKLKSLCSTVIPGQKYDTPLESNTVEFKVKKGVYFMPEDLKEPGNFNAPSGDEEFTKKSESNSNVEE